MDAEPIETRDVPKRFPTRKFGRIGHFDGLVDGSPVYFRRGDLQPRGYRVTIRMREPFGESVRSGRGFLCVIRGPCFLIPLSAVRDWLGPKIARQTVDIHLDFARQVLSTADLPLFDVAAFRGQD